MKKWGVLPLNWATDRKLPWSQLFQLVLCSRLHHVVRRHRTEFWDLLFVLTSGVTIWCVCSELDLNWILTPCVIHVIQNARVQVKDASTAVSTSRENVCLPTRLCFESSVCCPVTFDISKSTLQFLIQFGSKWGHMPRNSLVFSFEAIQCKKRHFST